MEQDKNISIDMSRLQLESPADSDVPANSDSENHSTIKETDDIHTETDPEDNSNDEKDSSFDEACKHIGSEKDLKSDPSDDEKKIVSCADAQGLDLAAELRSPECGLTESSKSASAHLNVPQSGSGAHSSKMAKGKSKSKRHTYILRFHQPGSDPAFIYRVQQQRVLLENVVIDRTAVKGTVCVLNLNPHKLIQVIYTTDGWMTTAGVNANFFSSDFCNSIDRFSFIFHPSGMTIGSNLFFYIKYVVNGMPFIDNNYAYNYTLECIAQ